MKVKRILLPLLAMLLVAGCASRPAASTPAASVGEEAQASPSAPLTRTASAPTELKVLFAGSLIIPFEAVEQAFETQHPEIDLLMEGHGSIQVIRHITELGELVDVAALADYALVPAMMYQNVVPETGEPFANWTIEFAANRMVLAFTPESHYADEIHQGNWYQILAREDVRKGLSDPRFDAAGYRALMVLQLSEAHYGRVTILENVLMGRFINAVTTEEQDGRTIIHVPEILQPKPGADLLTRSYSVQLIALLESGEIDYAFEYETVAQQHGLSFLSLPDEINLGSEELAADYNQVEVSLDFQRFATVPPRFVGETIGYGLTIPSNAPHPELAELFVAWLLGPDGRATMEAAGHPISEVLRADFPDRLPNSLQDLVNP